LDFGATAGAVVFNTPSHARSSASDSLAGILVPLGTIAGLLAIGLLIYDQGIVQGAIYWLIASIISFTAVRFLMDGFTSVLGLISIIAGGAWTIFAFQ